MRYRDRTDVPAAGRVSLLLMLLSAVLLGACRGEVPAPGSGGVVATFYPLYEVARQVGGGRAEVRSLIPAGTEPHDFDPTPRDTAALFSARLVVYNGAGFEPWLDRILRQLDRRGVLLVEATRGMDLLQMTDEGEPSKRVPDPHIWLDPVLMQQVVAAVRDAYTLTDPGGKAAYEANAAAFSARLGALHRKYQQELQGYSGRTIITSHTAFSYLAKRYGLEMVPIAGLSPIDEPSPQQLATVARLARERGVKYIFFETLVSPGLAETIAREAGAGTLVLNPLEGLTADEVRSGKDYISVMEENLANLKKALEAGR